MQSHKNPFTAAIAAALPASESCEQYLLQHYGATMSLENLAQEMGTTTNALRIRQLRCGDLPPRIPGMRGYRWPTKVIAAWINALVEFQEETTVTDDAHIARQVRRPGRPRKHRVSSNNEIWGDA